MEKEQEINIEEIKAEALREYHKQNGKKGGIKNREERGSAYFSMIGKKGAAKRWSKEKDVI